MIRYFFIIDFFENVELEMPVLKRNEFASVVEQAKSMVARARNSDGLIEKISDRSKRYHLYAKANDENVTVCILTEDNDSIKDEVWSLIKDVHAELKDFDYDKDKLTVKQEPVKRLLNSHMEDHPVAKIDEKVKRATLVAKQIKDKGNRQAEELLASLDFAEEAEQGAVLMDGQSETVLMHYWWEDKKMAGAVAGSLLIMALFLVAFMKFGTVS